MALFTQRFEIDLNVDTVNSMESVFNHMKIFFLGSQSSNNISLVIFTLYTIWTFCILYWNALKLL